MNLSKVPRTMVLAGFAGTLALVAAVNGGSHHAASGPAPTTGGLQPHAVAAAKVPVARVAARPLVHHHAAVSTHHVIVKHHILKVIHHHHVAAVDKRTTVHHGPSKPYTIYDSVMPQFIPAKAPAAVYATGPYRASASQVVGHEAMWIDTTGTDPHAGTLDVEPGAASISRVASWASERLHSNPHVSARIYTMISQWGAAKAEIATLPTSYQHRVKWWIADPNGVPHIVPGADATQYLWTHNFDATLAKPDFGQGSG